MKGKKQLEIEDLWEIEDVWPEGGNICPACIDKEGESK